jgi:hypothetical protein
MRKAQRLRSGGVPLRSGGVPLRPGGVPLRPGASPLRRRCPAGRQLKSLEARGFLTLVRLPGVGVFVNRGPRFEAGAPGSRRAEEQARTLGLINMEL